MSDTPAPPVHDRLARQLAFVVELDRLKQTLRQTTVMDASRQENSAEHSWHLGMMALLLAEYAAAPVDPLRVVKMVLVHDVIEIDAGDTFCYDAQANLDKEERERRAAARLFGLLPADQGEELRALWEEFEEAATPEARFAVALDRLQPLLQNLHTEGGTWRKHGITREQVLRRMRPIRDAMPGLWPVVEGMIAQACAQGWVVEGAASPAG
ncbi:MAG: HD domain-containing protein [Gemmatimonadota bacterium]|nr:HD domain-containing protein [Gemmatimonadota bacterium]